MKTVWALSSFLGKALYLVAGIVLALMFLLTLSEVVSRLVWRPIPGSYELISFLGGIVVGLSIPYTSVAKGHVNVDFLLNRMPGSVSETMNAATRLVAMAFFGFIGYSLLVMGIDLRAAKEVSQMLKIPFYPVILGIGIAFLVNAVQFFLDFLVICGARHE